MRNCLSFASTGVTPPLLTGLPALLNLLLSGCTVAGVPSVKGEIGVPGLPTTGEPAVSFLLKRSSNRLCCLEAVGRCLLEVGFCVGVILGAGGGEGLAVVWTCGGVGANAGAAGAGLLKRLSSEVLRSSSGGNCCVGGDAGEGEALPKRERR